MYEVFMDGVRMARGDNRNLPKTKQKGKGSLVFSIKIHKSISKKIKKILTTMPNFLLPKMFHDLLVLGFPL